MKDRARFWNELNANGLLRFHTVRGKPLTSHPMTSMEPYPSRYHMEEVPSEDATPRINPGAWHWEYVWWMQQPSKEGMDGSTRGRDAGSKESLPGTLERSRNLVEQTQPAKWSLQGLGPLPPGRHYLWGSRLAVSSSKDQVFQGKARLFWSRVWAAFPKPGASSWTSKTEKKGIERIANLYNLF